MENGPFVASHNSRPPIFCPQSPGSRRLALGLVWFGLARPRGWALGHWGIGLERGKPFRPIEAGAGRAPIQRWEIIMSL